MKLVYQLLALFFLIASIGLYIYGNHTEVLFFLGMAIYCKVATLELK